MKNELNQSAVPNERTTDIISLHGSNGNTFETWRRWKSGKKIGAKATRPLAMLCGLWLVLSLPAQEATNQPAEAVAPPVAAESSDATTNHDVSEPSSKSKSTGLKKSKRHGRAENAKVVFGKDVEVKENETVDAVVVIGGNALISGSVRDAVVAVGGAVTVRGEGEVGEAVVALMGNVSVEDNATVHGEAVAVGGAVQVGENATVEGQKQSVDIGALGLPKVEWLRNWLTHCALKLRPLAPQVGWTWAVAGVVFLLYLLVAIALPGPVRVCVGELARRPATTFLMGLLVKMLLPVVLVILLVTGIGVFIIPFVIAALFFGAIIGKVAFLEYLGFAMPKALGTTDATKPIVGLIIGAIILALLYCVPVLGLLTFGITGMWGLGAAVTAGFGSLKREAPEKTNSPQVPTSPAPTLSPMPVGVSPTPGSAAGTTPSTSPTVAAVTGEAEATTAQTAPTPAPIPPAAGTSVPEALLYPRASFWERMGAAFLDVVLVSILGGLAGSFGMLVALAYFAGMWAWKGTTIGGIVLNLKVVRLDGSPMTFAASLVRALAAAFSVVVLFLGFLWIIWDREKQGWHDRIAGTVVVRLPRGVPLVCL